MLHIARTHMNELGPPTLRDFVAKDTPNPLSREIKVFADPMLKANMTAEYFAAYWILYLLFRVSFGRVMFLRLCGFKADQIPLYWGFTVAGCSGRANIPRIAIMAPADKVATRN
jgi:hypothetical protein